MSCVPESKERRGHRQDARENFRWGDAVSFTVQGECRAGTIECMNPKRVRVRCSEGEWLVPYDKLNAVSRPDGSFDKRQ